MYRCVKRESEVKEGRLCERFKARQGGRGKERGNIFSSLLHSLLQGEYINSDQGGGGGEVGSGGGSNSSQYYLRTAGDGSAESADNPCKNAVMFTANAWAPHPAFPIPDPNPDPMVNGLLLLSR